MSRSGSTQTNLVGQSVARPRGCLYVDETKAPGWLYIGVLAVSDDLVPEVVRCLDEDRVASGYDRELHFNRITTAQKYGLASRWLERVRQPTPRICFHILGINLETSTGRPSAAMVNTRTTSTGERCGWRSSTPPRPTSPKIGFVRGIFHDARNLGAKEYFDWHTPWRLRSEGLRVATDQVVLVDSDHANSDLPEVSNAIQLIDLVLGVTRLCLDATNRKQYQVRLAMEWVPFLECLTSGHRRWEGNRQYGQVGRCSIGFFPSLRLTDAELNDVEARARSGFYTERSLALANQNAPTLW